MYITSLVVDDDLQQELNGWRARYFPAAINYLDAHITLFHALGEAHRATWEADLHEIAASTSPFALEVTNPYSLGRGVALQVSSPALAEIHRTLQSKWREFLSPQDLQKRRAHCTIQNKVTPEAAKRTLREVQSRWAARSGMARGFGLYEYQGGPWRLEKQILFKAGFRGAPGSPPKNR